MQMVYVCILFIYGIIFGSFFNVVGLRVPNQTLFKEQRSYCDHCKRTLSLAELIPIWSYVFQEGCCTGCGEKITILYPLIEAFTGFLFAYSYIQFGMTHLFVLALLLIALIIPVSVSDITYQKIPNRLLLFFMPLFIIYRMIYPLERRWGSLTGALLAFVLVFLIIYLSKGGIGMGDLKYYTLFGFVFGVSQFLLLFFLSTLYGVIAGFSLIILKKTDCKTKFAFGPYIGLAALTVLYFGKSISQWYTQLLN